ncbi:MAG: hypothetical protein Q4A60_07090 [Pasteurellaceae bacterium]|nr:hypothetical protein [Pasteurellaceae bacterium]
MSKQSFHRCHKCCYFSLIPLFLLFLCFHDMLLVHIITPYRCDMWKGKEVEVFLTPEEWQKLSGVNESLKDTEWIHYTKRAGETKSFFIENQGQYQSEINLDGITYSLMSVNNKHPNLNLYYYTNPSAILGKDISLLYDHNLREKVVQYNSIIGYYTLPFFGVNKHIECDHFEQDPFNLIKNYLK